jgi:hypothetical protein
MRGRGEPPKPSQQKTPQIIKTKLGFFIEAHFGKPKFTTNDLNAFQLKLLNLMLKRKADDIVCCDLHEKNSELGKIQKDYEE